MNFVHNLKFRHFSDILLLAGLLAGCSGKLTTTGIFSLGENSSSSSSPSAIQKSIRNWVKCDGITDDSQGTAKAFEAARNNALTLLVDCPVKLHIGSDIARTIFIDNGTTVLFQGAGKFFVDNILLPAFVIANSNNISLLNWNVEYDGGLPVDFKTGSYENNGQIVANAGDAPPSGAFNDSRMTPWMTANRGVIFDQSQGHATSFWTGPTNCSSIFFVAGDSANLSVTGMQPYVPTGAGGDQFIPMAFSFTSNYKSNQTINAKTPITAQYFGVPHDLLFSDVTLDGTYMGWQGNVQNAIFKNIISNRYGDLQDASGGNIGGVGKWFAPPHLFYLNFNYTGDRALFGTNIQIIKVDFSSVTRNG